MSPRPHVGPQRRKEILDAAAQVFARLGFAKARMEDIARQAGLSKATLYLYFPGKEALFDALLESFAERETRALREALEDHQGAVPDRLRRVYESVLQRLLAYRPLLPLFYEIYALAARKRAVRRVLERYYQHYANLLAQLLQEGIARDELRPGDPHKQAIALIAQVEGLILLWVMAPSLVDLEAEWRTSLEMLLRGLLPSASAEGAS